MSHKRKKKNLSELNFIELIEINFYKKTKHRDHLKIKSEYIDHARIIYSKANQFSTEIEKGIFKFPTDDQRLDFIEKVIELSDQVLEFVFQLGEDRYYNLKVVKGHLSSYSLFYLLRFSLINLLQECEYNAYFESSMQRNYLKDNLLLMFDDIPIHQMTQKQIFIQLQCLQKACLNLDYGTNLSKILNAIEFRIARLVSKAYSVHDGILDGQQPSMCYVVDSSEVIVCGALFIEKSICIISSIRNLILTIPYLKSIYVEITSKFILIYCNKCRSYS